IVLLDIVMPGMDGHAVAKAIRSQPETASTAILHVSAMTSRHFSVGQFTKTESGYFLAKPFMRKDLLEAIRVTLSEVVEP
ncbi:MAG TPA: hypothetical protein DCX06_13945, partial [Opitutae bacterium]|nr:hypothetical protein [Opitutae bacterium]